MSPEPYTEWTVVFIVHAADDQSRYYSEQLFTELLQAKSSPNVRVFVLRNTYDYFNNEDTHLRLWEILSEETASEENVPRKKRIFPKDINGYIIKDAEKPYSFGDMNIGNKDTLMNVLKGIKSYVKEEGRNTILFTWDHGCGFGIFNTEEIDDNKQRSVKSGPQTDMLMISELADAIKGSFGKAEMLIMMNCWMQSIETNAQYGIRENENKSVADVLIAAETSLDWLGYDYIGILNELVTPSITIDPNQQLQPYLNELAGKIIETTKKKYEEFVSVKVVQDIKLNEIIITATRPGSAQVKELIKHIDDLALSMSGDVLTNSIANIVESRNSTVELTKDLGSIGLSWCFVDILDVFTRINAITNGTVIDNDIMNKIKEIIPSASNNQDFYTNDTSRFLIARFVGNKFRKGESAGDYGGVSICFPNYKRFLKNSFYEQFYKFINKKNEKKIVFAQSAVNWAKFVEAAVDKALKKGLTPRTFGIPENISSFRLIGDFIINGQNEISLTSKIEKLEFNPEGSLDIKSLNESVQQDLLEKLKNTKLNANIDFSISSRKVTIHSLEFECFEQGKRKLNYEITRGAGDPKRSGPGDPKRSGPGELIKPEIERG
jgi:hypothetical protein